MVATIFGGLAYLAFQSFAPKAKKPRARKAAPPSESTATTTGTVYSEEWIPEHHLKKKKTTGATSGTSGDELSGSEATSPKLARRKSGRK
jgi:hypothetical protein